MTRVTLRRAAVGACTCLTLALTAVQPAAAAPTWLAPAGLASVGPAGSECPVLTSTDPQGDAFAVWTAREGGNSFVQASSRPAGGSWQAPASFQQGSPCVDGIASDARGDAIAVWESYNGKNHAIQAAYHPAGAAWQNPEIVTTEETAEVLPAQVALDSQGNAFVVWRSNSATHLIESSFKQAAGGWQAPQPVSGETQNWYYPQVAMDGAGNAVAVWQHRSSGTEEQIQAAFSPAGGSWQPTVNLTAPAAEVFRGPPKVAMNAAGQAAAVWGRAEAGKEIIQASTMPAAGSWQPAVSLSEAGQNAEAPQVAINARGDAAAGWEFTFEKNQVIQAASKPAGAAWGAATTLSEPGHTARYPHVAAGPGGEAIAIWERYNGSFNIVQAAVSAAGGAWQPAVNLSKEGENSSTPDIATDGQGNAVAVWESHDIGNWVVETAGYDAAGPHLNGLSIPASAVAGQPVAFSVNPLDVWSPLGTSSWIFGDGAAAGGAAVTHTYAAAGTFPVTLTGADVLGNTTSATGTIRITIAPPRPAITALRQSASRWREGRSLARISRRARRPPLGTRFSFTLNQRAVVGLRFTQALGGRQVGRRCVARSRANRRHKRCTRTVAKGTISFNGHSGANRVAFQGRISRSRRLAPGRYRLTVTAFNSAGAAVPRSLSFTIVAG